MSHVLFAGKHCGGVRPRPLVSLTNRLTVYFNTNDETNSRGFKAYYKAVAAELASGKSISAGKLPSASRNASGCPRNIKCRNEEQAESNVSGGVEGLYVSLKCVWKLKYPSSSPLARIS